jgi:hypothetical protein
MRNPLRMARETQALSSHVELEAARSAVAPLTIAPQSVLQDQSALQAVVWHDLTGGEIQLLSREAAMSIPALARQRHLLCGTAARCPLRILRGDTQLDETTAQTTWPWRTDGELSPYHRMLWTVDDLMFHGWSLWSARRGPVQSGQRYGQLLQVGRINPTRWETDEADRILVDGEYVNDDEVILIPGPHEGILNFGAPALRRTLDNLDAAANAARNPNANLELHYTGDDQLTEAQIDSLIERWAKARRGLNGGVAYTNKWLELKEHGTHEAHLLIEGRNADAVDMSRLVSSPAAMADATSAGASLTYETTEGRNGQFIDYGTALYMDAIAARLSMDDVVARGQRTAFDVTQLTLTNPAPTGANTPD